jgi:hypothetical protein
MTPRTPNRQSPAPAELGFKGNLRLEFRRIPFRLPVTGFVLLKGRTKLKHLSDFSGPPQ